MTIDGLDSLLAKAVARYRKLPVLRPLTPAEHIAASRAARDASEVAQLKAHLERMEAARNRRYCGADPARDERVRDQERERLRGEYDRARAQKDPPQLPPHPAPAPPSPPPTPGFPDSLSAATARYILAVGRCARGKDDGVEPGDVQPGSPPDPEHGEDDDDDQKNAAPGDLILRAIKRRQGK